MATERKIRVTLTPDEAIHVSMAALRMSELMPKRTAAWADDPLLRGVCRLLEAERNDRRRQERRAAKEVIA